MKTYLKTLARTFGKHITRFFSIIFIVVVSLGFISGIGSASDKIKYSLNDYYRTSRVCDFIVKSVSGGFSAEEIAAFKESFGEENVMCGAVFDADVDYGGAKRLVRLCFMSEEYAPQWSVCKPEVLSSALPDGAAKGGYAYFEAADNRILPMEAGTKLTLDFKDILSQLAVQNGEEPDPRLGMIPDGMLSKEIELCGEIISPLTFGKDGEPSYLNPADTEIPDTTAAVNGLICLEGIIYADVSAIPQLISGMIGTTDVWIAASDRTEFNDFSDRYRAYVDEATAEIESLSGGSDRVRVITLYDNYSFSALHAYAEKVMLIGYILMVAFLFVAALVTLSTMTRMLDEERAETACLKTLGYSSAKIIFKYLLFAALATGAGGVGAYFIGLGVSDLIYRVFNYSFAMPPMSCRVAIVFFLIVFAVIAVTTLCATLIAGAKLNSESCAELLRPRPPKAGRKTVIEKIPFIWNALSFKYKSTTRNVLRYKSRFIMTVVAVAISTALVLAGLALLDLCLFHGVNSPSVTAIALVVVVFAGLLTAVVIYTLTNINISERNRELATLMVLGYYDGEVAGYIYREIYIDAAIGIIIGMPLSLVIMYFLFEIMAMGSFATVSWFVWLLGPAVVLLFTALVTLLLRRKIVKIDMNESLKAIE